MSSSKKVQAIKASVQSNQTVDTLGTDGKVETVKVSELHTEQPKPTTTALARREVDITNVDSLKANKVAVHTALSAAIDKRDLLSLVGMKALTFVQAWRVKELSTGLVQTYALLKGMSGASTKRDDNGVEYIPLSMDGTAKPTWRYYMVIQRPDGSFDVDGMSHILSKSEAQSPINFLISLDANVMIASKKNGKLVKVYEPEAPASKPAESEAS